MQIRDHLLKENSKKNWQTAVKWIGSDENRFAELMNLFFTDDYRIVQRASQVMIDCCDIHLHLIHPYLVKLANNLVPLTSDTKVINAVKRNTMRIFRFAPIPTEVEGVLFDQGIYYLKSLTEPIAVKAFSMIVLCRICEKYPELCSELIPHIEILVEEKASSGIVNRGQKELKKLYAIQSKN